MTNLNTLFLRLEGPLQAWGDNSKFVIRRTCEAPTKSGVLGMICCAMGKNRQEARPVLGLLNTLMMGVRIDRSSTLWADYHTVGAKIGLLRADGKGIKRTATTGEIETLITRRYYLCDASFLVGLQGQTDLIREVHEALKNPKWPIYLGRKSCPPSVPVLTGRDANDVSNGYSDLAPALADRPWRPCREDKTSRAAKDLPCLIEWRATSESDIAPREAEVWHDVPVSFDPPVHLPRLVLRKTVTVAEGEPLPERTPVPSRPGPKYDDPEYKEHRKKRLELDGHLCIFCKAPVVGKGATVQHITYRHVGTDEEGKDLRTLCRLCHDAVTMIEYGLNMGLDRINPEDPCWREDIIRKRDEIVRFRSLETRRRRLEPEEVE